MAPSLWQILIVVVLLVLLFGRGKISALMGDVAKGIKSFKRGMAEDDTGPEPARVEHAQAREGAIDVTPEMSPEARKDRA